MGVVLPKPGFLEGLRKITEDYGSLLIFDEVITGFRLGYSGAQGYYNVLPDMTTMEKIIGGEHAAGIWRPERDYGNGCAVRPGLSGGNTLGNPAAVAAGIKNAGNIKKSPGDLCPG